MRSAKSDYETNLIQNFESSSATSDHDRAPLLNAYFHTHSSFALPPLEDLSPEQMLCDINF